MMTAQEVIDLAAQFLEDTSKRYYTQAYLYTCLQQALREIVDRSRCLVRERYISVTEDKADYALPEDFLSMHLVLYDDGEFYPLHPASLRNIFLRKRLAGTSGSPLRWDFGQGGRIQRRAGTATGGSATTLVETGINFPALGVVANDLLLNTTDDSEGIVTSAVVGTVTCSGGFVGGADNTPASGDVYQILSYNTPRRSILIDPAPDKTDTTGAESLLVVYAARHRALAAASDLLDIDPELDTPLIFLTMSYAAFRGPKKSERLLFAAEFERQFRLAMPKIKSRIEEAISMWQTRWSALAGYGTHLITVNGVVPTS